MDERFQLTLAQTVYTEFWPALNTITTPVAGDVTGFVEILQNKLDAPTITEVVLS